MEEATQLVDVVEFLLLLLVKYLIPQSRLHHCAADGLPHPARKELPVEPGLLPPAGQGLPLRYHHVEQKERQERQELVTKSVTS